MSRMDRLRAKMKETGADLVVLAPGAHMRWLMGFSPHADERACLLVVGPEHAGFVMPSLNAADARQYTDARFWEWRDDDGPDTALDDALATIQPDASHVVFDDAMRADHAFLVRERLPNAKLSFSAETLVALRMIKDADELAALEENARIADAAQTALRAAIRDGITERELAEIAAAEFKSQGARSTFGIVGTGAHSSYPHHHTGHTRIKSGDVIVVDIGGERDGYNSDITRMACLGTPPEDYFEVHSVVDSAVTAALEKIRPGVIARDVDAAARDVIAAAGYGAFFTHRTGHGLGCEIHEAPYITSINSLTLEEGMVFTVEPGIYLPGRFGVRLEEVAVVTKYGCRILSDLSRELYQA